MSHNHPENVSGDDSVAADDIALDEAFNRLSSRISTLTNAFDKFADRQEQLVGRDYSEELSQIDKKWEKARDAFKQLNERPALALTPEIISEQIRSAGTRLRDDEQRALREAGSHLDDAVRSLKSVVSSARAQRKQNLWIAVSATAAAILAFIAGCTVPSAIDRSVPTDWYWPERRAAAQMRLGLWDAGARLMKIGDPEQWQNVSRALRLYQANESAIAKCEKQAARRKIEVGCLIKISVGK